MTLKLWGQSVIDDLKLWGQSVIVLNDIVQIQVKLKRLQKTEIEWCTDK